MTIPATFLQQWDDRTRRAYDALKLHYEAHKNDRYNIIGMWVAVRLSDGSSDGSLYPTKGTAARFQLHETQCAYFCLPPSDLDLTHREVQRYLEINEQLYNNGMRLSDPDTHVVPGGLY